MTTALLLTAAFLAIGYVVTFITTWAEDDTAPTEPVDRLISGDYWAAEFNTDREHA